MVARWTLLESSFNTGASFSLMASAAFLVKVKPKICSRGDSMLLDQIADSMRHRERFAATWNCHHHTDSIKKVRRCLLLGVQFHVRFSRLASFCAF